MTICLPPKSHEPPLPSWNVSILREMPYNKEPMSCPEKALNNTPHLPPISMGSLKEPMTSLAMGFDHVYSIRHELPPVEQTSNPIRRVVGYLHT